MVLMAYNGYTAIHVTHRRTIAMIFIIAASVAHPTFSEIGRPLEPILTCTAVLLGELAGSVITQYLHEVRAQTNAGATTGNTPVEVDVTDDIAFASHQFQASFWPVAALLVALILWAAGTCASGNARLPHGCHPFTVLSLRANVLSLSRRSGAGAAAGWPVDHPGGVRHFSCSANELQCAR